jgi:hypothetical protein
MKGISDEDFSALGGESMVSTIPICPNCGATYLCPKPATGHYDGAGRIRCPGCYMLWTTREWLEGLPD